MDPWTIVAQIVNFLVFVALMHRILYRPVSGVMQSRREEMEADLREAREQREEADSLREEAQQRERDLEEKRDRILREARDDAQKEREETVRIAEEEAKQRLDRYRRAMENERREVLEETTGVLERVVTAASVRILADAAEPLNDRAIRRVAEEWKSAADDASEEVRDHFRDRDEAVRVRCAQSLTDEQEANLRQTLADATGREEVDLSFEEDESIVAGVAVTLGPMEIRADWGESVREALDAAASEAKAPAPSGAGADGDPENDSAKEEAAS